MTIEKTVPLKDLFNEKMKGQWCTKKKNKRKDHRIGERDTGFLNVRRDFCKGCTQGFIYHYRYIDLNGEIESLYAVDFLKLRSKVLERGYPWEVRDHTKASSTARKIGLPLRDLIYEQDNK